MNKKAEERYNSILATIANLEMQIQILYEKHRAHEELFINKIKELEDGIKESKEKVWR